MIPTSAIVLLSICGSLVSLIMLLARAADRQAKADRMVAEIQQEFRVLTEAHWPKVKDLNPPRTIANAMSTTPMTDDDRERCRLAVAGLYAAANLPAPRIVFVSSPLVARFGPNDLPVEATPVWSPDVRSLEERWIASGTNETFGEFVERTTHL